MADQPWTETTATVAACEPIKQAPRTWTGRTANLQLPVIPLYAVTFTYQANGQEYSGKYIVHAEEVALGHTFTICYDPENPQNNSGSQDSLSLHPTMRRFVVAAIVLLLILASHWFHNR